MRNTNFTDSQRAEIFVRDRATCAYTGCSLWILDYGLDPLCQIDWAEHIIPASKGGLSVLENGVAASAYVNKLRGNSSQWPLLFYEGMPTPKHTQLIGNIAPVTANNLIRFKLLHVSDWYLNRAMWHIVVALQIQYSRENNGEKYSRDYHYYANAALKMLEKWRRLVEKDLVPSLEKRGIIDYKLEPDQKALLSIREAVTASELSKLMKELFPIYSAAESSNFMLSQAGDDVEFIDLLMNKVKAENLIPKRIYERMQLYAKTIKKIIG